MEEGHCTFEHTGDLGLEVWAGTPERLHARAAEALSAQSAETHEPGVDVRLELHVEGDDPADLLVHWLNTVLLEAEIRRVVWIRAVVMALDVGSLQATLEGQRLDPGRQTIMREIKAVSHNDLELDLISRPCRCRMILDL